VTVTLHLPPEAEAGLLARARAEGMALEDYLLAIVTKAPGSAAADSPFSRESAVQRMLEFGDRHRLSLGAPVSRAALHERHRF